MQESAVKRMSTTELIRRSIDNLSNLIDKQMVLAGLEIKEDISSVFKGAGILILGMAALFLMAIALMVAAILALSLIMPGWLAALIFAALLLVVGGTLALIGRSGLRVHPLGRTRETITEDVEWARQRLMSSVK